MPYQVFCVKPQILKISNYFSFHLIPRYFWLSWLQRPGGSGTWLPPKGPELEAKEKNQTHSYLQPCKLYASLFILQGIDSGLLNFGAWQHCVLAAYFLCILWSAPLQYVLVCWVTDSLYRGVIVRHSRTSVRTDENFRVDPLPVEDVHPKSKHKQCWQCVSVDTMLFLPWVLKKLTKFWEEFKPYQNGKIGFFPWKWPLGWMRDYVKKVKIRLIYSDFLEIAVPTTLKCSCRILLKFSFKTTLKSWKFPQRTWIFPFLF